MNNIDWRSIDLVNIYGCILEISDIEEQKRVWNGKIPDFIASYDDVMLSLFDDFLFDDFIDAFLGTVEISVKFKERINLLRDKLKAFNGYDMKEKNILIHPKWIDISNIAKEVLKLWKENALSYE